MGVAASEVFGLLGAGFAVGLGCGVGIWVAMKAMEWWL